MLKLIGVLTFSLVSLALVFQAQAYIGPGLVRGLLQQPSAFFWQ